MTIRDKIKQMVNDAPTVSSGTNVNFGPLTVTPIVKTFHGAGVKPTVQTLQEFADEQGKSVDDVDLGKSSFALRFNIGVDDINEALDFTYEREVAVVESSSKVKTDWAEIVHPSLIAVFGEDWYGKLLPSGKKSSPTPVVYVAAEAVDSLRPVKEGGKVYNIPKFIAAYPNRDACVRAWEERYGKSNGMGSDEEEGDFPEETLDNATNLWNSYRQNDEKTLKSLLKQPFGAYDANALLAAVKAREEEEGEGDED